MKTMARKGALSLAVACLATIVVSTAEADPTHFVSWGGPDLAYAGPDWHAGPGTDYNASGFAVQKRDGEVTGQWQDNADPGDGGIMTLHARVVCLSVEGKTAWVLGKLTSPWLGGANWYMIAGFRDVGRSSLDDPDEATFIFFIEDADEADCSGSTAFNNGWDGEWYPYTKGQVTVK